MKPSMLPLFHEAACASITAFTASRSAGTNIGFAGEGFGPHAASTIASTSIERDMAARYRGTLGLRVARFEKHGQVFEITSSDARYVTELRKRLRDGWTRVCDPRIEVPLGAE